MLDLSAIGHTTFAFISTQKINYKYVKAVKKTNKKGDETFTPVRGESEKEISIQWHEDEEGQQHLTLWNNSAQIAKFSLVPNFVTQEMDMVWNPSPAYTEDNDLVAKPMNPNNIPIVSTSMYNFFEQWINSTPFAKYLNVLAREIVYPPKLVKPLLMFFAYLNVRTKIATKIGQLAANIDSLIDKKDVFKVYQILVNQVVGDDPEMKRLYADANQYLTLPSTENIDPNPVNPDSQESEESPENVPNIPETVDIEATSEQTDSPE